ncbi:NAD-dependent epimerase [uncultured Shewanella sp.]|uniref:NAD-dependent epimerase n=1 Tax=uncultured Shewanella sp. TaxID=173975 RepID=UPI002603ABCF|nr:NAD-dependent epimerase [uncultured Shewanella sp.]
MKYLVTGAAGFIGAAVVNKLCLEGHQVVGIDNLNDYYSVSLKKARLANISHPLFCFVELDLTDREGIDALFAKEKFDNVIHLAAQAGVRYSIDNPMSYADSNLVGQLTILEGCRHYNIQHLVYASSSSVYGLNKKSPFHTSDNVDHPISLYAATKKSNELMAHTYSHLYQLPTTGLRFFTVYGPWGRPDMALFKFTQAMFKGEAIDVYNHGDLQRDFTYIDDIVEGIIKIKDIIPDCDAHWTVESGSPASSSAPYKVYNVGHGSPVKLMDFIDSLEKATKIVAKKNWLPMQSGDVYQTYADTEDLFNVINYRPQVKVDEGINHFVEWYKQFYAID